MLLALLCSSPALATHQMSRMGNFSAQRFLIIPMTGWRARPISTTSLFHTLFNDFASEEDGTTYVQTGDIPAMWLRDSSAQTLPYLRFGQTFPNLRGRFAGVIERNARNIIVDPYANAFTARYGVWEEKWEVDSLAFPVRLLWSYWGNTGDRTIFSKPVHRALTQIVSTYECEQHHERCSRYRTPYRTATAYPYAGNTGMIWCAFRPSDDAVAYRYNIPQEMMAVVAMRELAALARDGYGDLVLARRATLLAIQIDRGIQTYGRVYDFASGWMYIYETDGLGHFSRMDDANLPDLLAIPSIGYRSSMDPVYLHTRHFVLSNANPYYFRGRYAVGLGSPHTPPGWVWPLGIITRALTSTTSVETAESITTLAETDSREFLIHESFDPNAYWHYTRAQFGWANANYAELIFRSIAGFRAAEINPIDSVLPYEAVSQTPTLTTPFVQLENQERLRDVLGDLLDLLK
ncbi:MAG: glycoside hydrolase family 125 protein [Vulcanimicrobiaceae bacterium]